MQAATIHFEVWLMPQRHLCSEKDSIIKQLAFRNVPANHAAQREQFLAVREMLLFDYLADPAPAVKAELLRRLNGPAEGIPPHVGVIDRALHRACGALE